MKYAIQHPQHRNIVYASIFLYFLSVALHAQSIRGTVADEHGHPLPSANVRLLGTTIGCASDSKGSYDLSQLPSGTHDILFSMMGYESAKHTVTVSTSSVLELDVRLKETTVHLSEIVVTGGRREEYYRESPVKINIINQQLYDAVQSVTLIEGLSYQPGLRVENNCQNCGFTQVRINGLEGPYAQVLVDNRPLYSSLMGVYGLEFIPTMMIDRVEVLRGGGSSLYGANAVAGTINVITKEPALNSLEFSAHTASIGGKVADNNVQIGTSIVNDPSNLGVYLFGVYRNRGAYDHDGDGYSDITMQKNTSLGMRGFYKFSSHDKLTLDFRNLNENRRGGNKLSLPPHESDVTESAEHHVIMGGITYEYFSPGGNDILVVYSSFNIVDRDSYYGAGQDPNAYGYSENEVFVGGAQYSHSFGGFLGGRAILTGGGEWGADNLKDDAPGYNRFVNQKVTHFGMYIQHDTKWTDVASVVIGGRLDRHSLLDELIFNPRINLLYQIVEPLSLRVSYSTGFRPPQTFDEDLHILAVGGSVQIIKNATDLKPEHSKSFSAAADYDFEIGFASGCLTLDAFHTKLNDVFVLEQLPAPEGEEYMLLERRNSSGATVSGADLELRLSFSRDFQIQGGFTIQSNKLAEVSEWATGQYTDEMLRTPDQYAYLSATWNPTELISLSLSGIYTGSMKLPHYAGYIAEDRIETSNAFFDATCKASYRFGAAPSVELYAGAYNLFNSYQNDFDQGPDRDAGYTYGPMRPRSFFGGITIGM